MLVPPHGYDPFTGTLALTQVIQCIFCRARPSQPLINWLEGKLGSSTFLAGFYSLRWGSRKDQEVRAAPTRNLIPVKVLV